MKVIVIGGGAAGMMAAITSAKYGNEVIILEKTSSLGNKIKITGKGRCNLTFDGDIEDFKRNIVKNDKFMYSSFYNFDNKDLVAYFESLGVQTKVERGARVFPVSDNAGEIVKALINEIKKYHIRVEYHTCVDELKVLDGRIETVITKDNREFHCDKCIIATGGSSFPSTGSSGDGFRLARSIGHKIIDIVPGLVPLRSKDSICKELQGLSLKNISFKLKDEDKVIYSDFGELLFAHFGITGPVVLSASSKLNRIDNLEDKLRNQQIIASIDLKPALDFETLDKRVCRDFEKYSNKEFKNSLNDLLPQKMIPVVIKLSGIDGSMKVHQISKEMRKKLVDVIKNINIAISGFMPLDIAIITCGGVDVKDVNPKSMESKIVSGVYFAGEVLDVDAYTGGYNLQIAFSTAVAAGKD